MVSAAITNTSTPESRCCYCYAEQIPPALSLAASVVAIFAALYFQNPYLTIPAACGVLGSFYAIFTARKVEVLTTNLSELQRLRQTQHSLQREIEQQERLLEEHKKALEETEHLSSQLNQELQNTLNENENHNRYLNHLRTHLQELAAQHSHLRQLKWLLDNLQNSLQSESIQIEEATSTLQACLDYLNLISQFTTQAKDVLNRSQEVNQAISELNGLHAHLEKAEKAHQVLINLTKQLEDFEHGL